MRAPWWLKVWTAVVVATGCVPAAPPDPATIDPPEPPTASGGPAALVDPFIGTAPAASPSPVPGGRGGDTFPGASAPFGAVQWSPDTPGAEHPSGYAYADRVIDGFSVTHFSGAGCANGGLLSFVPRSGPGDGPLGFHHERERARPGSYEVSLDDGTSVELAATTRAGIGRFRFPAGSTPELVIDNRLRNNGFVVPDVPLTGIVNDRTLEGVAVGGGFCGTPTRFRTYFRIEFDQPFTVVTWDPVGAVRLRFTGATGDVRARFALSGVGVDGALANLRAEVPGWSYAVVRDSTYQQWNGLLSRLTVRGGSQSTRRVFTTALYHALLHPNTGSDVDGRYLGFDGFVHRLTDGSVRYVNFSGWDIYRSQVQLLAVVVPEVARDVSRSLLADAEECGGGFPKWTVGNQETSVMVGDPGAVMVAGLDAFGAGPERADAVLAVMRRSAENPTTQCGYWRLRPALAPYLELGYTPSFPVFVPDDIGRNVLDLLFDTANVSTTLEYAVADTAIGRYASRHGDPTLAATTLARGGNWRSLFDPAVGYVRPRLADGSFAPWWTPNGDAGFTEGNAAQYTWMAPQDFGGVVEAVGGPAAAVARLDSLFEQVNAGIDAPHLYIGNEPAFATPWAYLWTGVPARTQDVVRRILTEEFPDTPAGLPGNDDLGATSSWLVWAGMGLYPILPGEDLLAVSTPLFDQVDLRVPGRPPVQITSPDAPSNRYLASAALDGRALDRAWLRFTDLVGGATLALTTSPGPTAWAAGPEQVPPSLSR